MPLMATEALSPTCTDFPEGWGMLFGNTLLFAYSMNERVFVALSQGSAFISGSHGHLSGTHTRSCAPGGPR